MQTAAQAAEGWWIKSDITAASTGKAVFWHKRQEENEQEDEDSSTAATSTSSDEDETTSASTTTSETTSSTTSTSSTSSDTESSSVEESSSSSSSSESSSSDSSSSSSSSDASSESSSSSALSSSSTSPSSISGAASSTQSSISASAGSDSASASPSSDDSSITSTVTVIGAVIGGVLGFLAILAIVGRLWYRSRRGLANRRRKGEDMLMQEPKFQASQDSDKFARQHTDVEEAATAAAAAATTAGRGRFDTEADGQEDPLMQRHLDTFTDGSGGMRGGDDDSYNSNKQHEPFQSPPLGAMPYAAVAPYSPGYAEESETLSPLSGPPVAPVPSSLANSSSYFAHQPSQRSPSNSQPPSPYDSIERHLSGDFTNAAFMSPPLAADESGYQQPYDRRGRRATLSFNNPSLSRHASGTDVEFGWDPARQQRSSRTSLLIDPATGAFLDRSSGGAQSRSSSSLGRSISPRRPPQ